MKLISIITTKPKTKPIFNNYNISNKKFEKIRGTIKNNKSLTNFTPGNDDDYEKFIKTIVSGKTFLLMKGQYAKITPSEHTQIMGIINGGVQ